MSAAKSEKRELPFARLSPPGGKNGRIKSWFSFYRGIWLDFWDRPEQSALLPVSATVRIPSKNVHRPPLVTCETQTGLTSVSGLLESFSVARNRNHEELRRCFSITRWVLDRKSFVMEEFKVHVGSLSYNTDEDSLRSFFEDRLQLEVVDGKWFCQDNVASTRNDRKGLC